VLSPAKLKQARKMIEEKTPVTEVAQVLGVSRATLYRRVPETAKILAEVHDVQRFVSWPRRSHRGDAQKPVAGHEAC